MALDNDALKQFTANVDKLVSSITKANESVEKSVEDQEKLINAYNRIGGESKNAAIYIESQRKIEAALVKKYALELKDLASAYAATGKVGKDTFKKEVERLNVLKGYDKQLGDQRRKIADISRESEKLNAIRSNEIDILKKSGSNIKAAFKEWKKGFINPDTGKADAGHAMNKGLNVAQNPMENLIEMSGIWGQLLKFIVETIDGVRKLTGELSAASAASGTFVGSMEKASKEAYNLASSQTEFAMLGFEVSEVTDTFKALKNTGLSSLGAVGGGLTTHAKAVIAFGKAAGESGEAVANRMASLVRNFGVSSEGVENAYTKLIDSAQDAAQKGYTTTAGYMQMVQSLGETFADTGVNIQGVNKILSTVGDTMAKLGRPMQNMQKIAQGIMGITKAGEGWQVFMAKMSGVQGGYAQTLFKAQQRGPGGMLAKAGEMDPMKYVEMGRNMLMRPTAGMQGANKQLMMERLGSQMGMDTETTQVFQKMSAGKITAGEAGTTLKKMWDEAKKQNMSTKGMFDIIKNILVGLIAKPVLAIYEIMKSASSWVGGDSAGDAADALIEEKLGGGETHARGARRVTEGGWARLSANEGMNIGGNAVVPASKMAKTTPYGGGGGLSITLSGNFQVDPTNLAKVHKQFDNMLQSGLDDLQNRMMSNTAG